MSGSTPSTSVTLNWGSNSVIDAMASVFLALNYSAVLLEDIPDVSNVDCNDASVSVVFSTQDEFDSVQTS